LFTGIIEEIGVIQDLRFAEAGAVITVSCNTILSGTKIGDSVCINGVCLTVTQIGSSILSFDISSETLRLSGFKQARKGALVNLERSLRVGDRLGGHIVQGHTDGIGHFNAKIQSGAGYEMKFDFPGELERYLVYKGSIAVNGISLTVSSLEKNTFSVAVIPHTYAWTNLSRLQIGDPVNLEVDILGKYFERFFQLGLVQSQKTKLTPDYLRDQGF
jgi:riboflavin synthase